MRKILLLLCMVSVYAHAQQVDTTTPYLLVDEKVVDTAKAIVMAKETLTKEVAFITSLTDKKIISLMEKSQITDKKYRELNAISDKYVRRYRTVWDTEEVNYGNYLNAVCALKQVLPERLTKLEQNDAAGIHAIVYPLPTKTIKVKKDNPNYADPKFYWMDKLDSYSLKSHSVAFPVKDTYYTSDIYQQFKFRKIFEGDEKEWVLCYDQSDNLLAITKRQTKNQREKAYKKYKFACAEYDYEHNAYNINQEDEGVQEYVAKSFANGEALSKSIGMFRALALIGVVNVDEDGLKKETAKFTPEIVERADNYIEQLENDNVYPWDKLKGTRIDSFNVLWTLPDGKLKIQETYLYQAPQNGEKEGRVKSVYKVLDK